MGVAVPPEELISWATVVMVESGELGSGGDDEGDEIALDGSLMVFAATTTVLNK